MNLKPSTVRAAAVAAFVACGGPALADTATALRQCRQISDVQARIACYDAIQVPAEPSTQGAAASPATSATSRTTAERGASSASGGPTAGSTAAATAAASRADPNFGLPVKPPPPGLDAVESTIVGAFDGWTADSRITLANGQVWQINDGSVAAYSVRRDPRVRITRGMLGSFFMEIAGVAQTPRVKRLK